MTIDELISQIEKETNAEGNTRARVAAVLRLISEKSGLNGATPEIGKNGNWWINGADTGVKAKGEKGDPGNDGTKWYTGEGKPDINLGNIDDVHLNLLTYEIRKKSATGWLYIGNIKGKSAYEAAVDGGYKGDEDEFNLRLAEIMGQ
jgi:hypothetical protein